MAAQEATNRVSSWMFFIGILLFLMGLYGVIRIIHISVRGVPYPQQGVLPTTILTPAENTFFAGRESDCRQYPQLYFEADVKTPRDLTDAEKRLNEEIMKRCIEGFDEERAKTKQYDRNQSAFLIFVGAGLIFFRRFLE